MAVVKNWSTQYVSKKLVHVVKAVETEQCQHPSRGEGDNKRGSCAKNMQCPDAETGATGGSGRMS